MAEGVGFEPTVALRLRLISSQVPLTTQPPFPRAKLKIEIQVFPPRPRSFSYLPLPDMRAPQITSPTAKNAGRNLGRNPAPGMHYARSEERRVGKECRSRW